MVDVVVEKFRRLYSDLEQVKEQFNVYDENGDGRISREEMEEGMTINRDFTREQAKFAFEVADSNGDGEIDISEFIQLMFPSARELVANLRKLFRGPADVERKFKCWDMDGDGRISIQELRDATEKESTSFLSNEDINAIFAVGDIDLDGLIDFSEFSLLMIPSVSDVVAKFRYAHRTLKDVKTAFRKYDRNGDGSIDKGELHSALTNYKFNFSDQEVDVIFNAGDLDQNGEITYEEFMFLMCPDTSTIIKKFRATYKSLNEVKAAFKKFDKNRDGALNKSEIARMMYSTGYSFTDIEVDAIMNLGDLDGDGEISLEEFVTLMSPNASDVIAKIRQSFVSIEEVKELFKAIDIDSDGLLSKDEMMNSPGNKFDVEEVEAIYELGDSNGDDVLDLGEFIAIMFPSAGEALAKLSKSFPNIDQVKTLFHNLDLDNDGSVTKTEMLESSTKFSPQEIESIFALGDINDDGAIDLEEFIGVMYPSASTIANRLRAKYTNINDVKKAFACIDKNADGLISREEMMECDTFNHQEIDALFTLGDSNRDGEIDLEEFIGVLYPIVAQALVKFTKDVHSVEDARFLFKQLDKDNDGLLSQEELRKSGTNFSSKEIEALFAIGDINNDGEIDINEFINVMCPGATTVVNRISSNFKSIEDIKECFIEMDTNCDGKISRCEMALFSKLNQQEVNAVFELGDADRDGEIDLNEFIGVMTTSSPVPYKEAGEIITIGEMEVYKVGEGVKCIIWCHDTAGFTGTDRTRQLVDKLSVTTGYLVIMPNFFGNKPAGTVEDSAWVKSVTDWNVIRDQWVEVLYPWLRDTVEVRCIGLIGAGWGAYVASRLASYGEVNAGVLLQPSVSIVVEAVGEDLYEVFEEVACPQLVVTARDDCPNEKQDGLAYRIFKSCSFGKNCEFLDLPDMIHGYLLQGERSIEAIARQSKVTMSTAVKFLSKFLHYVGEPLPVLEETTNNKAMADIDLEYHSSDSCRTCLAVRHQANKSALKYIRTL